MKKSPMTANAVAAVCFFLLLATQGRAIDPADWRDRQSLEVRQSGPVRVALPPATIDAAQPHLNDVRLVTSDGSEVPYLLDRAMPAELPAAVQARRFTVSLDASATVIVIETGLADAIHSVELQTSAPSFLKAARLEWSADGKSWQTAQDRVPVFRQHGAEQLSLDVGDRSARLLRVTLDDASTRPVAITGAALLRTTTAVPATSHVVEHARIARREEFADETVLTVDLGARNLPLDSIELVAEDTMFTRRTVVLTREIRHDAAHEQSLASGTLYRLSVEGSEPVFELRLPIAATARSRELVIRIENGDSPPLRIERVVVRQRPVWLVFNAPAAGVYSLLLGNRDASAPRYDLSRFKADLRGVSETTAAFGAVTPNPQYRGPEGLPETVLLGATLDTREWRRQRLVSVPERGVHQLELDVCALAGSSDDYRDLRLLQGNRQVPFVLERPALSRSIPAVLSDASARDRPQVTTWALKVPCPRAPVEQLTLVTPTRLFRRTLRVFERVTDNRGHAYERVIAFQEWQNQRGEHSTLMIPLNQRLATDRLFVETDNGDNPPITLSEAELTHPVVRMVFSAQPGELRLCYGNPSATAPRYDLALVADELATADRRVAQLASREEAPERNWGFGSRGGNLVFWGALSLVVIALLFVVAKLLPKPPQEG